MYSLAIYLYALLIRIASIFNKKAKRMLCGQRQTFTKLESELDPSAEYIWFHAASLGEFEQGRPLIEKIRHAYPAYKILLSFFSPSGYEVRKNYEGADIVCYLPLDTPANAVRFIQMVHPVMAVFIKYEFWANYLYALKREQIPTYIISAIFRANQLFFKPYAGGYRKVLHCFDHLFVQDEASLALLDRFAIRNASVSGDTRFDRVAEIKFEAKEIPLVDRFVHDVQGAKQFTLVAGSSWPVDEQFILPYFNQHKEMKLIIAPHEIHETHLATIEAQLQRPSIRLSNATEESVVMADCLIVDCFGKLSSIYRYGEVAYVGGGFGVGIHNVLEAAVYAIPVLFGPNYKKFKEARDLITAKGGFCMANVDAFNAKVNSYISYPALQQIDGRAADCFVKNHLGATDTVFEAIRCRLKS